MHKDYSDIINAYHEISNKHPRMSIQNRASQFAPFNALTGYSDLIDDISKIKDKKIDLYKDLEDSINNKLIYINEHIKDNIKVIITYFDNKNMKYIKKKCIVKKVDTIYNMIKLNDNTKISMFDIINIELN